MVARGKRESAPPLEIERIEFTHREGVRRNGEPFESFLVNLLRPFRARINLSAIQGRRFACPWLLSSAPPGRIAYYSGVRFSVLEKHPVS
jgi:hypothetical protein